MPVDIVLALEKAAADPILTRYLAAEQGYKLVPTDAKTDGRTNWHAHYEAVAGEGADVVSVMHAALADGEITSDEARYLLDEVNQAVEAYDTLREKLRKALKSNDKGPRIVTIGE